MDLRKGGVPLDEHGAVEVLGCTRRVSLCAFIGEDSFSGLLQTFQGLKNVLHRLENMTA